jgi:hypothetical protein
VSKTQRGKRDGTGPFKGSYQEQNVGVGRRQQAGESCPTKRKPAESHHGGWHDRRGKL